ncbi:MAG: sigma 54-interacting transcriptional regulator [Clostridia bacterium]|nr:sigma 54-interacting transcriptional regulator [Clostridia bacterium]
MLVSDIMTQPVITVQGSATLREAVSLFRNNQIYSLPVVDENGVIQGLFTKSHLLDIIEKNLSLDLPVESIMIRRVVTVGPNTPVEQAYNLALRQGVSRLPIVDEHNRVIGIVTGNDALQALEKKTRRSLSYYKQELTRTRDYQYTFDNLIGRGERIKWLKREAQVAARTNSTILISGESGTGKELLAHAIHCASPRRNAPFIKVNCAAVPEHLLESELFGYEEGSFTGAKKGGKLGKFELADGGTIFLDEIGDMPLAMQAKLLRVLQEREVEKIGRTDVVRVDVRVIAATNKDLEQMVKDKEFREDLYYRLNVIDLHLPALRDRREDIPLLIEHFLKTLGTELGRKIKGITPQAESLLVQYDWPGNIRELRNSLERAIALSMNDVLDVEDFKGLSGTEAPFRQKVSAMPVGTLAEAGEQAERETIKNALSYTNYNKVAAARILGVHRSLLYRKLKQHGLG